jgi:hypothetical protein
MFLKLQRSNYNSIILESKHIKSIMVNACQILLLVHVSSLKPAPIGVSPHTDADKSGYHSYWLSQALELLSTFLGL